MFIAVVDCVLYRMKKTTFDRHLDGMKVLARGLMLK
jgi:hypothetical protein